MSTIRARVKNGRLEPIGSDVRLPEGAEVEIIILTHPDEEHGDFASSFGGWKGLIDADAFLRDIRASRRLSSRPTPSL